jgi:CBS domain-containing protein
MQAIDGEARIAIAPGATAADALRQMTATQMGRLLVVESGRLMGLLSRSTLIRVAQLRAAFDERVAAEPSDAQLDSAA